MPPFNLLLLPLLGGFVFVSQWYKTRFYALRADGYRLLFYSAVAGVALLLISSIFNLLLSFTRWYEPINKGWQRLAPFGYSGRAAGALFLGVVGFLLFNLVTDEDKNIDRVILKKQNPLEIMLRRAMGNQDLIAISTDNGKVYVGFITSNFNPAFPMEAIALMPTMSGYRTDETKEVVFTINYTETIDKIRDEVKQKIAARRGEKPDDVKEEDWLEEIENEVGDEMEVRRFQLVIPVSEIKSAFVFDPEIYERHFQVTQTGIGLSFYK